MHIKIEVKWRCQSLSYVQLFVTQWTIAPQVLSPWDSPGKNTGVGCHSLFQGIFLTQGSNPSPACRQILYHLSHQESLVLDHKNEFSPSSLRELSALQKFKKNLGLPTLSAGPINLHIDLAPPTWELSTYKEVLSF